MITENVANLMLATMLLVIVFLYASFIYEIYFSVHNHQYIELLVKRHLAGNIYNPDCLKRWAEKAVYKRVYLKEKRKNDNSKKPLH